MTKLNWLGGTNNVPLRAFFDGGRIDIRSVPLRGGQIFEAMAFNDRDCVVWQSPTCHSICTAKHYAEFYYAGENAAPRTLSAVDEMGEENVELQREVASLAGSVDGLEFANAGNRYLLWKIRKELGDFADKDTDLVAAIRTLVSSHKRLAEKVDESRKVLSPTSIADIVDRLDKFEYGLKKLGDAVDEIRGADYR